MDFRCQQLCAALASAGLLTLAGCGGGSNDSVAPPPPTATTTNVDTTVVDGAISNALVCIDKNGNGRCETDELQGRTDASGRVTLAVPNADVGKYPIAAEVGKDATDAEHGAVKVAYFMSAPADQVAVVSPLTTLVQQTVASSGGTTTQAAQAVQDATGITASLFQDYTKAPAPSPTDGSVNAATLARMIVVTTQQQSLAIASALNTTAIDGKPIAQADLDQAVQKKLLELLPALVAALGDPAVLTAATPVAKEAAITAAATTLVASQGLTSSSAATVVSINRQAPTTAAAAPASAGIQMASLNFTDAANYNLRLFTSSLAQNTPDASNNTRFVERRLRSNGGNLAKWGSGNDPVRNSDLSWNGSAWVSCPINFENTSSGRDAQGNNTYSYCDARETGRGGRASFDIAGRTMAEVYAQARTAGYTNLTLTDPAALGSATFPTGSALFYQTTTPLTEAFAYYPAGANNPAGFSNVASQYSAAIAAGGDAAKQAANTACNASETAGSGFNSTTLESFIASKSGTPCLYAPSSVTYNSATYPSDTPNGWWGNSTASLGVIGTASLTPTATSTGFYTGNTLLRVAFAGSGTNPVSYYACKQRYLNGSTRSCTPIGTGTYGIAKIGDARVLTLTNPPAQAALLNYNRVFVERGGFVYFGYRSKPVVNNAVRLNTIASTAMLARLGVSVEDPSTPLALAAGSYQGTWDVRQASSVTSPTNGTTVFINANGSSSCQDRQTSAFGACTVTITDPATGTFTFANGPATASGSFNFAAGTASGVFTDPTSTPTTGNFIGGRR